MCYKLHLLKEPCTEYMEELRINDVVALIDYILQKYVTLSVRQGFLQIDASYSKSILIQT